jgi:hypothetical protein
VYEVKRASSPSARRPVSLWISVFGSQLSADVDQSLRVRVRSTDVLIEALTITTRNHLTSMCTLMGILHWIIIGLNLGVVGHQSTVTAGDTCNKTTFLNDPT